MEHVRRRHGALDVRLCDNSLTRPFAINATRAEPERLTGLLSSGARTGSASPGASDSNQVSKSGLNSPSPLNGKASKKASKRASRRSVPR